MTRRIVVIGAVIGLLAIVLSQSVSGFIGRNTFNEQAFLDRSGRLVWVTAQISCTAGERLSVEVRVSQERVDGDRHVGALAEGRTQTVCEENDLADETQFQEVQVLAIVRGFERLEPGNAIGTGLAITRDRGQVTGVRQWQPDAGIELVNAN